MSNNLAGLNTKVALAIGEAYTTNLTVWATAEVDEIVTEAVNTLYPRFARPLDASSAGNQITVVVLTYYYALPTGMRDVSRIDMIQADGTPAGPLFGRAWEIVGDVQGGTGKLHVGAGLNDAIAGDTLALNGYGVYDVTTNLIPDILVPLVIARSRVDAYHRVVADRQRFQQWLARNQVENVSINEMLQNVREAENEAERLERVLPRTWRMPVSGRVG